VSARPQSPTSSKPEFRIRLNGFYVPNIRVQKSPDGGYDLAVRTDISIRDEDNSVKETDLGWFVVSEGPGMVLEYRDETAWALLSDEMKRLSIDKGWNACTPEELIGILWNAGVLQ